MLHMPDRLSLLARGGSIFFTLLVAGVLPAFAQTLTPYDSGSIERTSGYDRLAGPPWLPAPLVSDNLVHDPGVTSMPLSNQNSCNNPRCFQYAIRQINSYVVFDVPAALDNIASVELRFNLQAGAVDWYGQPLVFGWQAWDVNSAPAAFQVAYSGDPTATGLALHSDLGSGIQYAGGSTIEGGAVAVALQGAALADLAAARGGVFGIGFTASGQFLPLGGTAEASLSDVQLVVTAVPEPETGAMLLLGFGIVMAALRRRRFGPFGLSRSSAVVAPKRAIH